MSRIAWTPYEPGDARDVSAWNTAMQALVTDSSNLDGSNFSQEGLTVAQMAHRPRTVEFNITASVRDGTGLTSTTWADFAQSGTPFNYGTNFTLLSGDKLKIRYRVFFSTRVASPGILAGVGVDMRLGIKPVASGEVFTAVRHIDPNQYQHGWVSGSYLYQLAGEIDYVRLQYQLTAAGVVRPHYAQFWGIRCRRTV